MIKIETKKGIVIVDDEMEWLQNHSIYIEEMPFRGGVRLRVRFNDSGRFVDLARHILSVSDKNLIPKHKNGNQLDFRRSNLEVISHRLQKINDANQVYTTAPPWGYRGVYRIPGDSPRPWRARHANKILGAYSTALAAAKAYDRYLVSHYGTSAVTNKKLGLY